MRFSCSGKVSSSSLRTIGNSEGFPVTITRSLSKILHCRPVERGWYPEFPPLFNKLTEILFGVDLNSKWRLPVTSPTFSDRERHRELWPNSVFANHGFYPMVEFLSSGCEVRRR